jgi:hypothetical protein
MKYFKVGPDYNQQGKQSTKWIVDSLFLMKFSIFRACSFLEEWPNDLAFTVSEEGLLYDVLFNPDGLFLSQKVRDNTEPILGRSVEWLPVLIRDVSTYYLLHPLESVELGPNAKVKQNRVSGNYTWVDKYDFASSSLPACFMIRQAAGSAAQRAGICLAEMIVNEQVRWNLSKFRGVAFTLVYESPD